MVGADSSFNAKQFEFLRFQTETMDEDGERSQN